MPPASPEPREQQTNKQHLLVQVKRDVRKPSASVTQLSCLGVGVTAARRQKNRLWQKSTLCNALAALRSQEEPGSHGFLLVSGGRWHEAPLRLRVYVRAVMRTSVPARSCGKGLRRTPTSRRERQERKHEGRSPHRQPRSHRPLSLFWTEAEIEMEAQREIYEGHKPTKAKDWQERVDVCCLCFSEGRPDPAIRILGVLRQRNEPRRLITYLTYQMCTYGTGDGENVFHVCTLK